MKPINQPTKQTTNQLTNQPSNKQTNQLAKELTQVENWRKEQARLSYCKQFPSANA
jgi:hypothetical protein